MNLWVVGKLDVDENGEVSLEKYWEFIAVFDEEAKAVAACTDWSFFVGPIKINENVQSREEWPNGYYPLCETGD